MLAQFERFNEEIEEKLKKNPNYDWREKFLLLGTDVISLFPSLSAENTASAVRKQAEKASITWEEIDVTWLTLYIHLDRELCTDMREIERFLPKRRKGRKGKEAGMGSKECDQRYINIEDEGGNWEWPSTIVRREDVKKLRGVVLEIAVKFFFNYFTAVNIYICFQQMSLPLPPQ